MYKLCAFLILILIGSVYTSNNYDDDENEAAPGSHDWDVLIFTQHWPTTVCLQWREKELAHKCSLPSQKDIWTVHGIWPTKLGTIGPQFCNSSWKFDINQLLPLEKQLEQYWINIEKDTPLDSLWKHEWTKHGTCATVLPQLNSENKYFGQGLRWLQSYAMENVLAKAGIYPNTTNNVLDLYKGLKSVLNKNPGLECVHDSETGFSYIFEIRICFNKRLELTDCDGIKEGIQSEYGHIITNCDLNKPIIYPNIVPLPPNRTIKRNEPTWNIARFYHLIKMIQWFTL